MMTGGREMREVRLIPREVGPVEVGAIAERREKFVGIGSGMAGDEPAGGVMPGMEAPLFAGGGLFCCE
jgi:hypothetical protein